MTRIHLALLLPLLGLAVAACGDGRGAAVPEREGAEPDTLAAAPAGDTAFADSVRAARVRDRAPSAIRGIYLNAYAAGSRNRLGRLMEMAENSEINAFVIDVKDERGIRYRSDIELAMELSQPEEVTIRNLGALADTLRARGIWSIARIVVFKDPILSKARTDWSIQKPGGGNWVDRAGNTWVSPWDERVWDYNISIAEEVARAGFDEIQFDYVRFPEPYRRTLPPQVHPRARGDRTDAIAAFLNEARKRLHPLGVPVAADLFGLTPNTYDDVDIGQQFETLSAVADHILPMAYPSHYLPTHLPGVSRPNRMPYETVFKSVGMAVLRNRRMKDEGILPGRLIPWLQAFNAPWVDRDFPYGPQQLRDQVRAVYDVGLEDWILWHPGSRYEQVSDAFEATLEPRAREYDPPQEIVALIDRFDRQGVRAARERAAEQARGETTDPEAARAARTGRDDDGR
jgi:hypothetical protein